MGSPALVMLVRSAGNSFDGTSIVQLPSVVLSIPAGYTAAADGVSKLAERRPGLLPVMSPWTDQITVFCSGKADLDELKLDLLELVEEYQIPTLERPLHGVGIMRPNYATADDRLNWQAERDALGDIQ